MLLKKLAISSLLLVCTTLSFGDSSLGGSYKKSHKPRTLKSDRVQRLAELSTDVSRRNFRSQLLLPMLRERVPDTDGNRAVQEHIRSHMSNLGWEVEDDTFEDDTPHGKKTFTNIIATQNPSAPRRLTLACHHDSKYFADFVFVAATDSAVPCAMLLDLGLTMNSTLWADNSRKARDISLQLVFFDGEEAFLTWTDRDSIYGARHLADKMEQTPRRVERELEVSQLKAMDTLVLLDLIGHKDVKFRNWFKDTEHLFERMQKIELRMAKDGHLEPADTFKGRRSNTYFIGQYVPGGGIQDDHIPFLHKEVPVLHLISYPFPKVWHTAKDDESALDYPTIHNLIKILRVFIAEYLHLSP